MHVVVFQQVRIIQQGWLNRNSLKTGGAIPNVVPFRLFLLKLDYMSGDYMQMHVFQLEVSKGN